MHVAPIKLNVEQRESFAAVVTLHHHAVTRAPRHRRNDRGMTKVYMYSECVMLAPIQINYVSR